MQTQRDRVNAYQFLIGRMVSALVLGDSSRLEQPERRSGFGFLVGLGLAVLIAAGFGIYGLIVPGGNTAWQQQGAILVEEETGTRYVYLDGELRPVLNHASALLVQGSGAHVEMIKRASLDGLRRGGPIGVAAGPQVVPTGADLSAGPWLLCLPGFPAPDGRSLAMTMSIDITGDQDTFGGDRYLPVASPAGQQFVVWRNVKFPLADPTVPIALGLPTMPPRVAPDAWLNGLPTGPVIGAAEVPGAGEQGPAIGGSPTAVGALFRHEVGAGQPDQFYVLRADGLAPLTATEFALLGAKAQVAPVRLGAQDIVAAPRSPDTSLMARLPDLLGTRAIDPGDGAFCLRQHAEGVAVKSELVVAHGADVNTEAAAKVRPAGGMLVAAVPVRAGAEKPDRFLIDDQGRKFELVDDDSISALGLGGIPPVPVATEVLDQLPSGPALSRAAAGAPQRKG
ncbi:type VII secretion protein EccB [Actinokineospora bangkokensis]|uniref:Type VII secretion protein EccB n=1 Tax=Actinokineospora bangkokensis TaxID=1193682 RepID=A0A1Q9LJG9_9PSEU|nr:type VII secretion protein EccB [Actinokineospora bangkokensis]OLR92191.1 type VII secretion protein EccB [Actinokineospora bangkokensis]